MRVKLNNCYLHCEEIVPDNVVQENVILLFLHEALGSIAQWKSFPMELCSATQIKGIVYEREGHGQSSPLKKARTSSYLHDYAFEELPIFLEKVIPASTKVILVGHSDGGTIALLHAHQFPAQIFAVITMAAHVINEKETIEGIGPAITAYENGKLDGLIKYHGKKTNSLFYSWVDTWRSEAFRTWNIVDEIGSRHPYLCIQGMDDQYGTLEQLRLIQSKTRASIVALENCGHHPHLEQKEIVIKLIRNFLKQHLKTE